MTHPTTDLDDAVHQRVRLGTLAIVAEAEAEFGFVQTSLGVTAGNLSRHVDVLTASRLVTVRKGRVGKRPRTWISITAEGRAALRRELAALRALLASVAEPIPASPASAPAPAPVRALPSPPEQPA